MLNKSEIRQAKSCEKKLKTISPIVIVLFLLVVDLPAQGITINRVDLFVKENILFTRLHISNFFDESMKETIASGMSRKFTLQFELVESGQKRLYNHLESLSLKYDVWERVYLLNTAGAEKQFDDIGKFISFFSDSTVFNLGPISRIDQDDRLRLFIIFSQQEISERQQKELKSWISHDAETVESQPALEANQSFSINISKLLSLFFAREGFADLYIYKSSFFTLKSLDENENAPK